MQPASMMPGTFECLPLLHKAQWHVFTKANRIHGRAFTPLAGRFLAVCA